MEGEVDVDDDDGVWFFGKSKGGKVNVFEDKDLETEIIK